MLKTKDFQVSNTKINLVYPTNTEFELIEHAKGILNNMYQKGIIYRAVGFSAIKLTEASSQQVSIFDADKTFKKQELSKSWDKLEERFGKGIIKLGG